MAAYAKSAKGSDEANRGDSSGRGDWCETVPILAVLIAWDVGDGVSAGCMIRKSRPLFSSFPNMWISIILIAGVLKTDTGRKRFNARNNVTTTSFTSFKELRSNP